MSDTGRSNALVVRGLAGQPGVEELEQQVGAGLRPRSIHVEVARALDADVIDFEFLERNGSRFSRMIGRRVGILEGQVLETYRRRNDYGTIVAFADRIGLELALLCKLTRSRSDLVLVSSRLTGRAKRLYLERARVQTHLREIMSYSSVQLERGAELYGLPREHLHPLLQPVDERFFAPSEREPEDLICSVGCIAGLRDYPTLVEATRNLPIRVELAVGSFIQSPKHRVERAELFRSAVAPESLPENVTYRMELPYPDLRDLYARSRFVVMPLKEIDFDAGVTTITEAMAMGKAVICSRVRGQVDVLHDGVEGIYVPPDDPTALRAAIEHLLAHPEEAERMGAAGRAAVVERHRLEDFAARVAAIALNRETLYSQ